MEKITKLKPKKIQLSDVRVKMTIEEPFGVEIYNDEEQEENDTSYEDYITGEIIYGDFDLVYDEYEKVIGTFKMRILHGTEQKIYHTLSNTSITDIRYEEEIFNIKYYKNGSTTYHLKDEYFNLIPEVHENLFIILDRIEINEMYRGNGVLNKVINTIHRIYRSPILTKPFPLQYEGKGEGDTKNFKSDMKKVINSYMKCGFIKPKNRSSFLIKL
jgi:hypothetical protein